MLMATPRRHHPYAGVGMHMMPHHQHHPMMMPQAQPQQLVPPPAPMHRQSSPMYGGQPTIDCHSPPVSRTYQYKKVGKPQVILTHYRPDIPFGNRKISENPFRSVLSKFFKKISHLWKPEI